MRPNRPHPDPFDAVLDGENRDEDLLEVAVLVHDLHVAYRRRQPLEVGPELAEFTGAHLSVDEKAGAAATGGASVRQHGQEPEIERKRPAVLAAVSGFVATLAGKVVLGTTVAAASVGGLQAADVVDLPVLPDSRPSTLPEGSTGTPSATETTEGTGEDQRAESSPATTVYVDTMQTWTDCVAEYAPDRDASGNDPGDSLDQTDECGERPDPADLSLDDSHLPDQAADAAHEATEDRPGPDGAPDVTRPDAADGPNVTTPDNAATPADGNGAPENTPAGTRPAERGDHGGTPGGRP